MIAASPGIIDNGWTGMGKSSLKFFSVGNFQQRTVEFDVDTYKSKPQNLLQSALVSNTQIPCWSAVKHIFKIGASSVHTNMLFWVFFKSVIIT